MYDPKKFNYLKKRNRQLKMSIIILTLSVIVLLVVASILSVKAFTPTQPIPKCTYQNSTPSYIFDGHAYNFQY